MTEWNSKKSLENIPGYFETKEKVIGYEDISLFYVK